MTGLGQPRASGRGRLARFRAALPHGRTLPDDVWRGRHGNMVAFLVAHVPALAAFAVASGQSLLHVAPELLAPLACAAVATSSRLGRTTRASFVALGLLTCSALLVHIWDGRIEAHFHFFVALSILALYEDWLPFGLAVAYIALHHGIVGVLRPSSVFDHADAIAHPWRWAVVHASFVVGIAVINVTAWRSTERDRARRRTAERLARHEADHDGLTGLASRESFRRHLGAALERADTSRQVAVIFLDVDDFKVVNDSLGHAAGDELLVAMASRLRHALRPDDVAARFGGDEFVACLEGVAGEPEALQIADRVSRALLAPVEQDAEQRFLTCSVGIALAAGPGVDPDELIRDADLAMYRAKEDGKARVDVFSDDLRQAAVERLELETGLRGALAEQQFVVEYQPGVDLATGEVTAAEALLRWMHPVHGRIAPDRFIPIAEACGLIVPIGAWVLREATRQAVAWARAGAHVAVAVNVSPRQLADDDFERHVRAALAASGLPPERLFLEVTESAVIADPQRAVEKLGRLKALGIRLALDDFGVGESSLSQLRALKPVDTLKIDKSFVDGIAGDIEDRAIVRAVVELARSLGMRTVGEGIEHREQAEILRELGCTVGQGWHFSRAIAGADVPHVARAHALGGGALAHR